MADDIRMPAFSGNGLQDTKQHMFVCEAIWTMKQINDPNVCITQLATTFRDRALVWYMKYQSTTAQGATRALDEIKRDLIAEFKKPKSESQCITELKEIKQGHRETVWDFNQRFKSLLDKLTFALWE